MPGPHLCRKDPSEVPEGGEESGDEEELNQETRNEVRDRLIEDGEIFSSGFDVGGKETAEHDDGDASR